ncbi:hypothetical protein [Capnocytophaga leadbetteri]|nr:hypothetical protein [Capnocytophaga leadbetteri]
MGELANEKAGRARKARKVKRAGRFGKLGDYYYLCGIIYIIGNTE